MRIRYLVLMVSLFLVGISSAQTSFAHPPNLHDDTVQEQTQTKDTAPEHDEQAMADHHKDGAEVEEHSHAAGGHDNADGHHDEAGAGGHDNADGHHDAGGGETGGHSHWGISPESTPFSKFMAAFGKFHPLIVHFPIALFLTAAFAQVLNMRTKGGAYDKTVSLLVWLGALGALGAGLLGWAHSGPIQVGENIVMSSHRWIGTSLLICGMITAYVMTKASKTEGGLLASKPFNLLLFAMALGVAINGFLGGSLAHGGIKHLMPGMM